LYSILFLICIPHYYNSRIRNELIGFLNDKAILVCIFIYLKTE
jgi:hypothetical protein